MLVAMMEFRNRGIHALGVLCRPDPELVAFFWELLEIADSGGDIRERLIGPDSLAA